MLRFFRKPPALSAALHNRIMKILPISLIIHLCVALYMYGQPFIFPTSAKDLVAKVSTSLNTAGIYEVTVTSA